MFFDNSISMFELAGKQVEVSYKPAESAPQSKLQGELIAVETDLEKGYVLLKNGMIPWCKVVKIVVVRQK